MIHVSPDQHLETIVNFETIVHVVPDKLSPTALTRASSSISFCPLPLYQRLYQAILLSHRLLSLVLHKRLENQLHCHSPTNPEILIEILDSNGSEHIIIKLLNWYLEIGVGMTMNLFS